MLRKCFLRISFFVFLLTCSCSANVIHFFCCCSVMTSTKNIFLFFNCTYNLGNTLSIFRSLKLICSCFKSHVTTDVDCRNKIVKKFVAWRIFSRNENLATQIIIVAHFIPKLNAKFDIVIYGCANSLALKVILKYFHGQYWLIYLFSNAYFANERPEGTTV